MDFPTPLVFIYFLLEKQIQKKKRKKKKKEHIAKYWKMKETDCLHML